jgi:hypothetical protein
LLLLVVVLVDERVFLAEWAAGEVLVVLEPQQDLLLLLKDTLSQ